MFAADWFSRNQASQSEGGSWHVDIKRILSLTRKSLCDIKRICLGGWTWPKQTTSGWVRSPVSRPPLAARSGLGWSLLKKERETKYDHNQNTTRTSRPALLHPPGCGVAADAQALFQRPSIGRYRYIMVLGIGYIFMLLDIWIYTWHVVVRRLLDTLDILDIMIYCFDHISSMEYIITRMFLLYFSPEIW